MGNESLRDEFERFKRDAQGVRVEVWGANATLDDALDDALLFEVWLEQRDGLRVVA